MSGPQKRHAAIRMLKYASAPALLLAVPSAADASFIGFYDPANWTFSNSAGGDGFVDTSGAPASVFVQGADNFGSATNNNSDYTIAVAASGNWSFSWAYTRFDSLPYYDFGGYLLNGVFTSLATNTSSGAVGSIAVNAGDLIGFRVNCTDCGFGPGRITISNFEAPEIPEPATLSLMALGMAGLAAARRRRRAS